MKKPENPLLSVEHLEISFRADGSSTGGGTIPIVRDVSFSVEENEIICIVGESGSGKTVTAKAILRLLPPDTVIYKGGSIFWRGKNILTMTKKDLLAVRGSQIAMIFQDPMSSLNPVYTIGRQMLSLLRLHKPYLKKKDAISSAGNLLRMVEIEDASRVLSFYPHQLSGGMRQRVMIAMALVSDAALLIADEPTTALDVTIQAQIFRLLKKIQAERNISILLITHDLLAVHEMADRVIVFRQGKVVEEAEKNTLFYHPREIYTKRLLNSMPRFFYGKNKKGIYG